MDDPMILCLARRPPLIDNAGAPVPSTSPSIPLIVPDTTDADQRDRLLASPTQHITKELGAVLIARATHAPQLALLLQTHRTDG